MTTAYRSKPTDDELLAALVDGDPDAAAAAATVLGLRGADRALDALIELLAHSEPGARAAAATALGLLGNEAAVPVLERACLDDDPGVASAASLALRRLGVTGHAHEACDHLVEQLQAADPERRALAARALGGLMHSGAVEPLITALSDRSAQVRADAAGSLGWIGDDRAVPHVLSLGFTDPDPRVRRVAMHAVAQIMVPETPL